MGNETRVLHLVNAGQKREDQAVDCLLAVAGQGHPQWYSTLGIDPVHHWCLIRPKLRGVHPTLKEIEVDLIFGNLDGMSWPPILSAIVAVEAKAWEQRWEDLEEWNRGSEPKSNLWKQVKRNRDAGFYRVVGIDIVCTEPAADYWGALRAASTLGTANLERLRRLEGFDDAVNLSGYAVFAFGAVGWKDERSAGALPLLCSRLAPALESRPSPVRDWISATLADCTPPRFPPYHFWRENGRWGSCRKWDKEAESP